jgi:UPF0755 protein
MNIRYSFSRSLYRIRKRLRGRSLILLGGAVAISIAIYVLFIAAPSNFPTGAYINIPQGSSLSSSAKILEGKHVVRSPFLFKVLAYFLGGDRHVVAGEYFFPTRISVLAAARRIANGEFDVDPARVRIPEGATVTDISKILAANVPDFNPAEFLRATRGKEGYLFPDTYFFMPGQGTDAIVGAFDNNFNTHIAKIQSQIDAFGKPLSDVVIMASLLEREAPTTADRRVIAGILWKRIKLGMPLQVDAVFPYIIGKNSFDLTKDDLQSDSPYNTYTHKGLPPGAIANPGIDAILAAVTPIKTDYLFYLSDLHGTIHYSATYEQHLAAKSRYLDN